MALIIAVHLVPGLQKDLRKISFQYIKCFEILLIYLANESSESS